MTQLIFIGLAGALGSISRHLLGTLAQHYWGLASGTFLVNALGCFVMGLLGTLIDEKSVLGVNARLILLVGFLGAFTTYSSFAYETWLFIKDDQIGLACLEVFKTLFVCLAALIAGVWVGRVV
jgi:CrcB protein